MSTATIHAPKHMRKSEPKAELHELEKAWRIAYVCECCAEDKATRDTAKALRKFIEQEQAQQAPEPTTKPAPKAKAARKSTTMPEAPAGWWNEWFDKPWVKHGRVKAGSSIVKLVAEGGHGAELRAAGWQYSKKAFTKPDGKKVAGFWWASKDADKARERGERYLANKAARAEQAAAC